MCVNPRNPAHRFICFVVATTFLVSQISSQAGQIKVQSVVQGSAVISQQPNNTVIQAANNTIINYTQFDVDAGQTATFVQPNAQSRVLNRVISSDPSYLLGTINANGRVYFVNPSGVVIGTDAVINAAQFHAAAGNISNADFLANIDRFVTSGGVLTNEGTINASDGVTLIGGKVLNTGTISTQRGVVALVSGSEIYLAEQGSSVRIRVDNLDAYTGTGAQNSGQATSEAGVLNEGTVSGGDVLFSCGDVYSLAVINSGSITANGSVFYDTKRVYACVITNCYAFE